MGDAKDEFMRDEQQDDQQATLGAESAMTSFLMKQAAGTAGGKLTEREFHESYAKEVENMGRQESKSSSSSSSSSSYTASDGLSILNDARLSGAENLDCVVLKFTTLSEANTEAPSFTITSSGATIGRGNGNGVSVPSDARLSETEHAKIVHENGRFYLVDGGYECAASLRIGVGSNTHHVWVFEKGCRFSAGNSIFVHSGTDSEGNLQVDIVDGPLKGERKVVTKASASTIGRSSDNAIALPDRELSRRHSKIAWDSDKNSYVVSDVGSTNGTYMQLLGLYKGKYQLNINDHILVGRTGFSVNRFDYGISEEIGYRQSMEDSCAIIQHLNVRNVTNSMPQFFPQSFFAVYDGHGGSEASAYLSRTLHVKVAEKLNEIAPSIAQTVGQGTEQTERLIVETLKSVFSRVDDDFVNGSEFAPHGSTATTALLIGNLLFCANTGDSRTMLCRNFEAMPMTTDHKPSREDESARIRQAGGFVINKRVMGELAVSRAFGDADFKKGIQSIIEEEGPPKLEGGAENQTNWDQPLIIAEPDVEVTTISENDQFLLLACDGLFDVFSAEDVVTFVKTNMEEHGDTQRCCQNLTYEAIRKRNSRDNVSVILIILNRWY
jgi:serine/threonine protein phosphatase PrpC